MLMMANDFRHDEIEEFLGKGRIKTGLLRKGAQPLDLLCLAVFVRRRQFVQRLW